MSDRQAKPDLILTMTQIRPLEVFLVSWNRLAHPSFHVRAYEMQNYARSSLAYSPPPPFPLRMLGIGDNHREGLLSIQAVSRTFAEATQAH